MRKAYLLLAFIFSNLLVGSGAFVAAKLSVAHDPSADPYKYCFKVYVGANNTLFGFPLPFSVPPGYYAICRLAR